MARREGRDLEVLVHAIESSLADDKYTTVESPGWLIDKSTSERREFDVLITRSEPHRMTIIAIECKDWNRPLDATVVEQFKKKCEENGVHRGVIVARVGFSRSARRKAARLDIDCLTLKQATGTDWSSVYEIVGSFRRMVRMEARLEVEGSPVEPVVLWQREVDGSAFSLSENGHRWMCRHFEEIVESGSLDNEPELGVPIRRVVADVKPLDHLFVTDSNGTELRLSKLTLVYEYTLERTTIETQRYVYGDPDGHQGLKVSTATLPFRNPDDTVQVTIVEAPDGKFKIHHTSKSNHVSSHISRDEGIWARRTLGF